MCPRRYGCVFFESVRMKVSAGPFTTHWRTPIIPNWTAIHHNNWLSSGDSASSSSPQNLPTLPPPPHHYPNPNCLQAFISFSWQAAMCFILYSHEGLNIYEASKYTKHYLLLWGHCRPFRQGRWGLFWWMWRLCQTIMTLSVWQGKGHHCLYISMKSMWMQAALMSQRFTRGVLMVLMGRHSQFFLRVTCQSKVCL